MSEFPVAIVTVNIKTQGNLSLVYATLVDPASSHMLVSKIKPCMSKY